MNKIRRYCSEIHLKQLKMKNKILFFIIIFTSLVFFHSCNKDKLNKQACSCNKRVLTENYNTDSVYIYVPNAFTPNNDGMNDLFFIIGIGFEELQMKIYKRNKLIFESFDSNNYWDGTNSIGEMQIAGIYKYYFKILSIHDEEIEIEGEVSLLQYEGYYIAIDLENCGSCLFPNMIHPNYGAVYSSNENIRCE
jgi:gliding motility-associated-like protein